MEKYPPKDSLSGYPNVESYVPHSRQLKIDNENGFLECTQDIKKLLDHENIQKAIFMQKALQMIIQSVKLRKTSGDGDPTFTLASHLYIALFPLSKLYGVFG